MRCNTGVPPSILLDQHLIAEYRELLIPFGQLRSLGFRTPSIPDKLSLGKGHITFWRDKQLYLKSRHEALVKEMRSRGFNTNYSFWNVSDIPERFLHSWSPDMEDSQLLRKRISEKYLLKPEWYRFHRGPTNRDQYLETLLNAPVEF